MPSTTAVYTSLSALAAHARRLDVIGNNIANANTLAFKASRMMFAPLFNRTLSPGSVPGVGTAGTNPIQIGLGTTIAGTQRIMTNGPISLTGIASDLAIDGNGFFIANVNGERHYTRAGVFQRNQDGQLVTLTGGRVMGYGVDGSFNVVDSNLTELSIPVGSLSLSEQTTQAVMSGNLNPLGEISTTGSRHHSTVLYTDPTLLLPLTTSNFDLTQPGNDLYINDGQGGSQLAISSGSGTIITVDGVLKDGEELASRSFAFSSSAVAGVDNFGTSLQDFMDFLDDIFGLQNDTIDGQMLGGEVIFAPTGFLIVLGNHGASQNLEFDTINFTATNNGAGLENPIVIVKEGKANGESLRTRFTAYDSIGTPVEIDVTFVLREIVPGGGTIWQYIAESSHTAAVDRVLDVGVVEFDASGELASDATQSISLLRENGAETPLTIDLLFSDQSSALTALADLSNSPVTVVQNGTALGTLSSFSVGDDGVISGVFTNGLIRTLGQVALAQFANPEGLDDAGNGFFRTTVSSGEATVAVPGTSGAGRIVGGALELSNVDLSQEFIEMILASTGYTAASRVISTTNDMLERLLQMDD